MSDQRRKRLHGTTTAGNRYATCVPEGISDESRRAIEAVVDMAARKMADESVAENHYTSVHGRSLAWCKCGWRKPCRNEDEAFAANRDHIREVHAECCPNWPEPSASEQPPPCPDCDGPAYPKRRVTEASGRGLCRTCGGTGEQPLSDAGSR